MLIKEYSEVRNTRRRVDTPQWTSVRMLLQSDGMGFSFHITTIREGAELTMHYKHHLEAVYCVSGSGSIEDLRQRRKHVVRPGVLYALNEHDRHVLRADTELILVCVFNPPLSGREVHDDSGAYPLPAVAERSVRGA